MTSQSEDPAMQAGDSSGDGEPPPGPPTSKRPRRRLPRGAPVPRTTVSAVKRSVAGASRPIRSTTLWRGDAPTEPIPIRDLLRHTPYRNPHPARVASAHRDASQALDLALRVGELMFRCGAGAPQVEASVIAVAESAGLQRLELDITNQSLIAQCSAGEGDRVTLIRVVRSARRDFARLAAVHDFVDSLVAGGYDPEDARARLRQITTRPRTFPKWVETVSRAVMAGAVALLLGAGPSVVLLAVGAALAAVWGAGRVSEWLPDFYTNAVGAAAAVLLAFTAFWAARHLPLDVTATDFAYIVAGGIVVLLPGRTMASAFEDVLSGYPVTGAGRMFAVFVSLTGTIIGVGGGLSVALWITEGLDLGLSTPDILDMRAGDAPVLQALVGAFITGVAGAVSLQSQRRMIVPSGLIAALGVAVTLTAGGVGIGAITATGLAGVVIGCAGRLVALQLGAPPMVLVHPATFALMPGLVIFRGLYDMIVNARADAGSLSLQTGITTLLGALALLLAVAAGATLGDHLAGLMDHDIVQSRRRRGRSRVS